MGAFFDPGKILVTGATGFLGSHCCRLLLEQGYQVRGTTRDLQNAKKVKPIKLLPRAVDLLELVEADTLKPQSLRSALAGCTSVLHVGSPVPEGEPDDERILLEPIVDGLRNFLHACRENGKIKRIVYTSAIATVVGGKLVDYDREYSEADWTTVNDDMFAFSRAKTLAEKMAWNYIRNLPEAEKIELVVLNPTYIMGPILHGGTGASQLLVRRLMNAEIPALPNISLEICDVRDVAKAHLAALLSPTAAGQRFIINGGVLGCRECAELLHKEFGPKGYKIPLRNAPKFAMWIGAKFDKSIQHIMPRWGKFIKLDTTKMREDLGITPIPIEQTVLDMAYSMIEVGIVPRNPH